MSKQSVKVDEAATPSIKQDPHSVRKKMEILFRIGLVFVVIVAIYIGQKVYIFQTDLHFKNIREGNLFQLLLFGLPFAVFYSIIDWSVHYYLDDLCDKYYLNHQKKYTLPEARKKRSYTLVKWSYSSIYYILVSIWAYTILKQTTFMPTWLGGMGSPYSMSENLPKVVGVTFEMKVFYIVQFGKHFSRFFVHTFIRPEGGFYEFALHHGVTILLIVFSYLTNQWIIGVCVSMVHDYSDFALITARTYKDYKNNKKIVVSLFQLHGFLGWVGCRLILFTMVCILPSFGLISQSKQELKLTQFEFETLYPIYVFMLFMMCCLVLLNCFWLFFICQSIISEKISSKVKHTFD